MKELTEKQKIDAIARDICRDNTSCTCKTKDGHCHTPQKIAERLVNIGYEPLMNFPCKTCTCFTSCAKFFEQGFENKCMWWLDFKKWFFYMQE